MALAEADSAIQTLYQREEHFCPPAGQKRQFLPTVYRIYLFDFWVRWTCYSASTAPRPSTGRQGWRFLGRVEFGSKKWGS